MPSSLKNKENVTLNESNQGELFGFYPIKPFLKWAGGKGQLISEIRKYYPFEDGGIRRYAEPFVGGGAVLFDILSNYELDCIFINDINTDLINAYRSIKEDVESLIERLGDLQKIYLSLPSDKQKAFFLDIRSKFNELKKSKGKSLDIEKAAYMIFLNKTCFNGLYRVNAKNEFNVPAGRYKNPLICDETNLRAISKKLQNVIINSGDYRSSSDFIDSNTFVYFDPPYRPLSDTSNFNSYTEFAFDDREQIALAEYVFELDKRGAKVLLSNSDPKNTNKEDDFFDNLYANLDIRRIPAKRFINSKSELRGPVSELLISNFQRSN